MCACDEEIGRRCLPHQIGWAHVAGSREAVTLGFLPGVCNCCRGVPEEAHPNAEMHGRTSKVSRYYWREIGLETLSRFDRWARDHGIDGWLRAGRKHADVRQKLEREVLEEIKAGHAVSPKYTFREESQDDVVRRCKVEVLALQGIHVHQGDSLAILDPDGPCGPEEFATRHFRRLGYEVLVTESRPFHVLFGVFMWVLIQDATDPLARLIGFGDRNAFETREKGKQIITVLPTDFGSAQYARRRSATIETHFQVIGQEREDLLWLFDYWINHSEPLRQYLWAQRDADVILARRLLEILPPERVTRIVRFLLEDYWGRYLGWPDLLCYRQGEFFFAEVKSSKDKLSQQQKQWIGLNASHLRLPFRLVKIHRAVARRAK